MTDTGDNRSIRTRTDASVPLAPRLGANSSSGSASGTRSSAARRTLASIVAAGGAAPPGGRAPPGGGATQQETQAEALGQQRGASNVSTHSGNKGDGLGDQESLANSSIQSGGSIPLAPPLSAINVGASVQGGQSAGGAGSTHVRAEGGKTRVDMLFSAAQDTPDYEIERETGVILPRDERGRKGSSDYKKNRAAATESIEHKFGVAKHYVSSLDGEAEDGDATKNRYIQEA